MGKGSIYERELKKNLESKDYYVVRSAGSFSTDLLAVKKGRVIGSQVKSCKAKVYYLSKRDRKQVEGLKQLKKYGIEGVFAVRFKDYKKTWVFMKPESVRNKVESTDVSTFDF